jgi:tetratricopeptide (TPR) repeat protein
VKEYSELLSRYPADAIAHNQRGACLVALRNFRGATDDFREALRMLPNHVGLKTNLALMTALSGDFEGAEQLLKSLPQMNANALQVLAYSQIARDRVADASDSYRKLGTMGPTAASTAASGLADLAIYQGRFSEAVQILEKGAADDVAAKNTDRAGIKWTSVAYANLLAGRTQAAVSAADRALSMSKSMKVQFLAGRVLIDGGAIDKARPLAAGLSSALPAEPHTFGRILEGLIALKTGKFRDAVGILTEANGILDTWFGHFDLGRAYLAAGELPQADSEFDRCSIARRGEALSLVDEGPTFGYFPMVYYYQGRVREGLNTAGFVDVYRKYLDIRGGSTEDPLVRDVRKRVSQ